MNDAIRDHLFVSYATEDEEFAEWLTLRLTREGYRVWCDRTQLLGGESYPKDIDAAIKNRTFRFLAVLSPYSLAKPNPLKERTLALNLGRQRDEQFLIPLNLTGLRADELDWMTSDLTFIPFQDWADGFARLLKALEKAGAPRAMPDGGSAVTQYIAARSMRRQQAERLWSNVVEVTELPDRILRVSGSPNVLDERFYDIPQYRENNTTTWVFEMPADTSRVSAQQIEWRRSLHGKLWLPNVVVNLLRQYINRACQLKGLVLVDDGGKHRQLHFPSQGEPTRWLPYKRFDGLKSRLKATGERNFWIGQDLKETTRYHLAPVFLPTLDMFGRPAFVVRVRLHLTDLAGKPLPLRKAISRRKKICANWWNDAWLARVLAVLQWLTDDQPFNLAATPNGRIVISSVPILATVPEGIDEGKGAAPEGDDESDLQDDEAEEGDDSHE